MVATIRHNFTEAVVTYEDKPREQWIFDPPAQVSVNLNLTKNNLTENYDGYDSTTGIQSITVPITAVFQNVNDKETFPRCFSIIMLL